MLAAVFDAPGSPPSLREIETSALRPDEVLVAIAGVGVCHTDLTALAGAVPLPTPAVLGHEGAGVVEAVGAGVSDLSVGDHVVLTFDYCGDCAACGRGRPAYCASFAPRNYSGARPDGSTTLRGAGGEVHGSWFGQSSWATHAIADVRNAVRVDRDAPLRLLGPLGCGLLTGAGTVRNVLRPEPGQSAGFWGIGTVGLAGVMAAKAAGASTIVAVDVNAERLALARELGATHTVDPSEVDDVPRWIRKQLGGLDCVMEAVGTGAVIAQALASLRSPGVCATVGLQGPRNEIAVDQGHSLMGRTLTGVIEGDAEPHRLIPELIGLWRDGRFPMERLITEYPLVQIDRALADFRAGRVIKPVLVP
ncbi:MAG: NAD(P)-dependent alcohol dehydrogenase [Gordonia sp. (in: high G+C Gram-positive bacteria)]|uniref:NAD(P)-dependent alcohol dehydrogenase n=1 Tax=Gordonia sp. (in: high G+C Gram-positive bacteria) TaxID=84139 RepID=UPI0039E46884